MICETILVSGPVEEGRVGVLQGQLSSEDLERDTV